MQTLNITDNRRRDLVGKFLADGMANNVVTQGIHGADRGQQTVGNGGVQGIGVGGCSDAIHDDITMDSVGIVQAGGEDSGNFGDGSGHARIGFEEIADFDGGGNGQDTVDIQVVAGGKANRVAGLGIELNIGVLGLGVGV